MVKAATKRRRTRPAVKKTETPDRILDIAQRLVQTRGYNAFSYADVSQSLGITKASLHYHFPSKAELGKRLIERYTETFRRALADIEVNGRNAPERLRKYVALYAKVLRNDRMCLCGMLAAEHTTLPKPMQSGLKQFFDENEHWLTSVLADGQARKRLHLKYSPRETARLLVGSLEGAMILARSLGDTARFEARAGHLLSALGIDK